MGHGKDRRNSGDSVGESGSGGTDGDGKVNNTGAEGGENSRDVEENGKHVEDRKGDSEDSRGEQENGMGVSVLKLP
jgi:hypothetical protein